LLISAHNTNDKSFEQIVNSHPEKNKKLIMQKWQAKKAQMCLDNISETQMDALQGYKANSAEFPLWNSAEYSSLVAVDINAFPVPLGMS
jgi:hypothetical protein